MITYNSNNFESNEIELNTNESCNFFNTILPMFYKLNLWYLSTRFKFTDLTVQRRSSHMSSFDEGYDKTWTMKRKEYSRKTTALSNCLSMIIFWRKGKISPSLTFQRHKHNMKCACRHVAIYPQNTIRMVAANTSCKLNAHFVTWAFFLM